jgi:hypothetical protein
MKNFILSTPLLCKSKECTKNIVEYINSQDLDYITSAKDAFGKFMFMLYGNIAKYLTLTNSFN